MARKPRVHFKGALYHVMARGNQGQRIFKDRTDRQLLVQRLKETQESFGHRLYAYVLMGNHLHLLIEVDKEPLSKIMQNLLFRYTRHWNHRYHQKGHLFQGRYKAILCQKDSYLLELIRYLHLNPVRSRIVKDPRDYAWSSHRAYLEGNGHGWIAVETTLPYWGENRSTAVRAYQHFVRDGLGDGHRNDFYTIVDQRYLGDEPFIEKLEKQIAISEPEPMVELGWQELKEVVCKAFGISMPEVIHRGRGRRIVQIRRIMAWLGREVGGWTHQAMARELKLDPAVLSRGLAKLSEEMGKDRKLWEKIQRLCQSLRKGRKPKRSIRHA